ncbi:C-GCAxxG-C-C family (seleno)protein [Gemmatimonadota bacterium]
MNRRIFLRLTATGAAATGAAASLVLSDRLFTSTNALGNMVITDARDVKKIFMECGTCSRTFFHLLNRAFGYPLETEELASDPLAGGLMNTQHQCGMLWGSALAVGAESLRRHHDRDIAIASAITATQHLVASFSERTKCVDCRDITCDFNDTSQMVSFMARSLPGGMMNLICMNLAETWAPEAIRSATAGLSAVPAEISQPPMSCASEVAEQMGFSDEEVVMVAGLAGGMGLSGKACGALGAAIWLNSLAWCREHSGESGYSNPKVEEIMNAFNEATGSRMLCSRISGRCFETIGDHTDYVHHGGCDELIDMLARV